MDLLWGGWMYQEAGSGDLEPPDPHRRMVVNTAPWAERRWVGAWGGWFVDWLWVSTGLGICFHSRRVCGGRG